MSQNKKLREVLDEVEEVRSLIQLVAENIAIVKDLYNNVLSYTNKDLKTELNSRTYAISQTSFRIQRKLREMAKDISSMDDLNVATEGPIHMRIKALQYSTMIKLFSEIMEDYNLSMLRYHEKCRILLHHQKLLIRKHITSDELEKLLDNPESSLFVDNILEDSKIARQQLSDIQSRHNDLIKIEKSLVEIRDMFAEMAFFVEKQGEQINNIEHFAGRTADNVDSGRTDLQRAEKRSRRYKKTKIKFVIIIMIIIILLILLSLLWS